MPLSLNGWTSCDNSVLQSYDKERPYEALARLPPASYQAILKSQMFFLARRFLDARAYKETGI
jgi:hypothetical protein